MSLCIDTIVFFVVPYTVTKGPELFQTEFAGSTAVLMCEATGYPIPVITWLKNLRDLTVDPRFVVLTVNGSGILYIRNVSVFDEGLYSCVISQPNLRSSLARQSTNLTVIDGKFYFHFGMYVSHIVSITLHTLKCKFLETMSQNHGQKISFLYSSF